MDLAPEAYEAALRGIREYIDQGEGRARLVTIAGAAPGDKGTPGKVVSEHLLSQPCGQVKDATLFFGPIADDIGARMTAKPTWALLYNADRKFVLKLKFGRDINLSDGDEILEGQTVSIASLTIAK